MREPPGHGGDVDGEALTAGNIRKNGAGFRGVDVVAPGGAVENARPFFTGKTTKNGKS